MLYGDVDFKTLSDRYTNSRMVPFLKVSPCRNGATPTRFFVLNLFDKKKRFCDFWDTYFWIVSGHWNLRFKKVISFLTYVKIRYENFHCSVIVDNMKEDCGLLEKLRKLQRVVHVLCALYSLGFKNDGKVRKLERYITQRSVPVWVLTSRHTEYE